MFATLRHDLKSAVRNLASSPGFAAIAVLSLAIGIGATTTVFSLINTIAWKPLPYRDADRLTDVYVHHPVKVCEGCGVGGSYPDYLDWRARARVFSEMGAYNEVISSVATSEGGQRTNVTSMSASMFSLLDVQPVKGRIFGADDDRSGAPRVALINERLWNARFQADPAIVGSKIRIDGVEHTVIGVMPERFSFPLYAQVWTPIAPVASTVREQREIGILARVAPGRTMDEAQAEMTLIGKQLQLEHPEENGGWNAFVAPWRADLADDYDDQMPVLLGAVFFVLLIACANLGSLLLARAVGRRRELAVRATLGAGRSVLIRQLMTESGLVAAIGGGIGLLLAAWGVAFTRYMVGDHWPRWMEFTIDWRVALFAVLISVAAALMFGLLPAVRASQTDVNEVLKDAGRSGLDGRGGRRLRSALVIAELSLSLVLLACAGLFARAAVRSSRADPGYDTQRMVRAEVAPPSTRYETAAQRVALADALIDRLHQVSGVSSAALSTLYIRGWPGTPAGTPRVEGTADDSMATTLINHVRNITPEYFTAYQTRMRNGRSFTAGDRAGAPLVAVVSESFADRAWPGASAIGKRIRIGAAGDDPWRTIVGVTDDADANARQGGRTLVYLPYAQFLLSQPNEFGFDMVMRTTLDEAAVIAPIRAAIAAVEKDASVENLMSMNAFNARMSSGTRNVAYIASSLALFALLIASIGIYGVVAFGVSQRRHEIGVRMALGANPSAVKWMIVRQAMKLTGIGLAVGVPAALLSSKLIQSMLFRANPFDIPVYIAVVSFFVLVTLFAAWLPARRAAHVDPLIALRAD